MPASSSKKSNHHRRRHRKKKSRIARSVAFGATLMVGGGGVALTWYTRHWSWALAAFGIVLAVMLYNQYVGFSKHNWGIKKESKRGHDTNRHFTPVQQLILYLLVLLNSAFVIYSVVF